jgi:hypothetical protein
MKTWSYAGTEPHRATEEGGAFADMPIEHIERVDRVRLAVRTIARKQGLFDPPKESYVIRTREDGHIEMSLTINGVTITRAAPPIAAPAAPVEELTPEEMSPEPVEEPIEVTPEIEPVEETGEIPNPEP